MAVATQNGSVGALSALCASAAVMQQRLLSPGLKAWSSMIRGMLWWSVPMLLDMGILRKDRWKDVRSTEKFRQSQGPKIVMDILEGALESSHMLEVVLVLW